MTVPIFVLALVLASALSVYGQFGGGHNEHHHLEEYIDYKAPPHYHWDYAVHDLKHHDIKSQHETRDHDQTKGVYTLLQPDGRKRIVEYVAGKHGVDYKVRYEGHSEHGGIGSYSG
ncbi:adult-specific cuticular protein ACP-22-like isoform X2 [Harmonia axyridis]|uniref:adult-specific cuticular protein ACP-22-like isoform X2 n=1 Tax=Harmonia axyridis TaxID=115357 RepID=UPI001E277A89|nr:adult-specific cuticular protein ACP-22-like isoform X2 [Harmonia axyridis]